MVFYLPFEWFTLVEFRTLTQASSSFQYVDDSKAHSHYILYKMNTSNSDRQI